MNTIPAETRSLKEALILLQAATKAALLGMSILSLLATFSGLRASTAKAKPGVKDQTLDYHHVIHPGMMRRVERGSEASAEF